MTKLLALVEQETIIRNSPRPVQTRGMAYFTQNKVELISLDDEHAHLHVEGRYVEPYCVDIELDFDDDILVDCDCAAFEPYQACKHIVAALLHLKEKAASLSDRFAHLPSANPTKEDQSATLNRLIEERRRLQAQLVFDQIIAGKPTKKTTKKAPYFIFFSLVKRYDRYHELYGYKMSVSALPEHLYDPVNNQLINTGDELSQHLRSFSRQLKPNQIERSTKLPAETCLNIPQTMLSLIRLIQSNFYGYGSIDFLNHIESLATLNVPFFAGSHQDPFNERLDIVSADLDTALNLSFEDGNLCVRPELILDNEPLQGNEQVTTLNSEASIAKVGNRLVFVKGGLNSGVLQMAENIGEMRLSPDEIDFFVDNYLPKLLNSATIRGDALEWTEIKDVVPRKQLYLTEEKTYSTVELIAELVFNYNEHSVPYVKEFRPFYVLRDKTQADKLAFIRIYHDDAFHQEVKSAISTAKAGLKKGSYPFDNDEQFVLRANATPLDFLLKKIPYLVSEGFEVFGEENLKSVKVNRHQPSLSLNVSSGIDWFDVQAVVKFGDMNISLPDIRKAVRRKEQFVKLADGSVGQLPQEWLDKYKHLFNLGEQTADGARFNVHHLTLIDQLLHDADDSHVDDAYQAKLNKLQNFKGIKSVPLPAGFQGELRPYQKAGYDWLHFLQEFQFGGCLADDMGLGKTVQMLAFLASVKENLKKDNKESGKKKQTQKTDQTTAASLIVMPRSLLLNWEREAAKFTPNLTSYIHFGPDRADQTAIFDQHDLILTTYGILRRDIKILKDYPFESIVLDESQAIKNPATQVSKAVRLLQGKRKLTMSGTPVENSTFELWAQFAFLNPGLLGGVDYFKREFGNPIEKKQDEDAANYLKAMVYPFILRRTKSQVAPDLPPRTDEVVYTDMEPAQRRFYDKTRDKYRAQLLGIVAEKGVQGARMKVLEGLLRLRQICNHPKLVNQSFKGDSAKMLLLMERLENLAAPDEQGQPHKALIFSQFVQMLKLVEGELKSRGLNYSYLDGSTTKRQAQIDAFQNDPDIPFFLISLKAGGVGLNLTAADYVIHVDPWWNPAVEMQATDRTHRIGQDKPVFVSKLITKNSVEEKILELQERKKKLVDQLIAADSNFFKNLTSEDIQVLFS